MNALNETLPEYTQGSTEWLELRKTKVTASDAPIIMGVSKWKTPLQLYNEKKAEGHIRIVGPHIIRGITLEPEARELFCIQNRVQVEPRVVVKDWAMASLDGISEDGKTLVEIKCPGKLDHERALDGEIPEHYYPQLQHQMWICDLTEMYYYSFDGTDGVSIKVKRDDAYVEKMIEQEKNFYNRMLNNAPPDAFEEDYNEMTGCLWELLSTRMIQVKTDIGQLQKEEKEIRDALIELADGKSSKGKGVSLRKVKSRGAIDYDSIPELYGVDLEKYRKPETDSWRLTCL